MIDESSAVMGIAAGCIALAGEVWYNWTMYTGRSRPDPIGRWVLALTGWLIAFSHFAVGGGWSGLAPVAIAIGMTVSACLSISRGGPLLFGPFERSAVLAAMVGLLAWILFGVPLVTLLALIVVDSAAMSLNIRRAWRVPGCEAPGPWMLTVLSDVVNIMAMGTFGSGWIFPCYLLLANGTMLLVIIAPRMRLAPLTIIRP